jgi:hypothetical protein
MPITMRIATTVTVMSISTKVKPDSLFNVVSPQHRVADRHPMEPS